MKQQATAFLLFLLDQFEQRMAQAEFGQSATPATSSNWKQGPAANS